MWKLRSWKPGETRPTIVEVYADRDIGADLQYEIDKNGCTRVEAVRRGHPADPPKPVKAQKIEWELNESYPKGEEWVGRVHGRMVAQVTRLDATWGGGCHYHLELGPFSSDYHNVANVESGKRAVQAAFTKVVRSLVGGN